MVKTYSYDPHGAISRAREFLKVGKKSNAVSALHSFLVLMVKRGRPWDKAHADVITLYLNICVDLRDAPQAKDGLHQYRSISQQTAPLSLRQAVMHLITASQKKLAQAVAECDAQAEVNATSKVNVYGYAADIVSHVSLDSEKDRLKRVLVKPWVLFLWESYRSSLELLRNNQSLHPLYHQIAIAAYDFCVVNECYPQFKRLCDTVRRHYENIHEINAKPESSMHAWEKMQRVNGVRIDLAFTERQLTTRFKQMEQAAAMDQWTEVWRTIQDIHDIMTSSQRELRPRIRAEYYLKVSKVFLKAENPLFHAYALAKHYALCKHFNRGMSKKQLAEISSTLLLATIAINTVDLNIVYGSENQDQKNRDIATQLQFDPEPSRDALLSEILQMGILADVAPEVKAIYDCLEEEFMPLQLVNRFENAVTALKGSADLVKAINLSAYYRDLEVLAVVRLLEHLSSVYDKFLIPNFAALISKTSISFAEVETIIARQSQRMNNSVNVQIDHQSDTLNFHSSGPESDRIHAQLGSLSERLQDVVAQIEPIEKRAAANASRTEFFAAIKMRATHENSAMQKRQGVIESLKMEKERQRYIVQQQEAADAEAAEKEKIAKATAQAEKQKQEFQERQEEIANRELQAKQIKAYALQQLGEATAKKLVESIGKALTREQVDSARAKVQEKKQRADDVKDKKKHALRRHVDYSTRAVRETEIPMIEEHYKKLFATNVQRVKDQVTNEYAVKRKRWEDLREKKAGIIHLRQGVGEFHRELMESRQAVMAKERRESNRIKRAQRRLREAQEAQAERRLRRQQLKEEALEEELRQQQAEAEAALEAKRQAEADVAAEAQREEDRRNNRYVPPGGARFGGSDRGGAPDRGGFGGDRFGDRSSGGDRYGGDRSFGERRGGFGDRDRAAGFGDRGGDRGGYRSRGFGGDRSYGGDRGSTSGSGGYERRYGRDDRSETRGRDDRDASGSESRWR